MMPVPRTLSSSCGTCVRMEVENPDQVPRSEETEQVALEQPDGYRFVWKAEGL